MITNGARNLFDSLIGDSGKDRPAVEDADGRVWSRAELRDLSAAMARVLIGHGVQPNDRVLVKVPKSIDALALYLAVLRLGAVFVPLNTAYTLEELQFFIDDAEPRVLVLSPRECDIVAKALSTTAAVVELIPGAGLVGRPCPPEVDIDIDRQPNDPAAILYTSGTTGKPKGAVLSNDNLLSNARVLKDYWRFGERDVLVHALPIFHAHGLFVGVHVSLLSSARMIFLPVFEPGQVLEKLPKASVFMGVPTFYSRLLSDPRLEATDTSGVRLFVSGSAPLSPEMHRRWRKATGHVILERYGMTETGMNASNPYDTDRRPGSVGFPLPSTDIRIVDTETREILPQGETGEIELKGTNVFAGYWRRPDRTDDFSDDGYFRSGDLGYFDSDGYLIISGRAKELIISGGYNVYPKEVENAIEALGLVAEVAVFGVPHADFGEGVTAAVVVGGDEPLDAEAMLAALRTKLANYKLPKMVLPVPTLPRNAMGKVVKAELQAEFKTIYDG